MIKIWHGSHRWQGPPEIKPLRTGKYEHGPGIYATTNLNRAARYAKGGGRLVLFELDPSIQWLEDKKLPFEDVITFVKQSSHIRKKRILVDDLQACWERRDLIKFGGMIPAAFLVNLGVNNECFSGKGGVEVANFLSEQGIQASLYGHSIDEDWVIIFDPKVICSHNIYSSKDIDWINDKFPNVKDQLELATDQGLRF